jgi:hypothetical protein
MSYNLDSSTPGDRVMTVENVITACASLFLSVVGVSIVAWLSMRPPTPARLLARLARDLPDLQGEFFEAGVRSGRPRGVRWKSCEWGTEHVLARDRTSQEIVALVSVALHLEPGPTGEEERSASAVFFYNAGRWQTMGKTVLNLRPSEVLSCYGDQYEPLSAA